jgi:hypothetical protein
VISSNALLYHALLSDTIPYTVSGSMGKALDSLLQLIYFPQRATRHQPLITAGNAASRGRRMRAGSSIHEVGTWWASSGVGAAVKVSSLISPSAFADRHFAAAVVVVS